MHPLSERVNDCVVHNEQITNKNTVKFQEEQGSLLSELAAFHGRYFQEKELLNNAGASCFFLHKSHRNNILILGTFGIYYQSLSFNYFPGSI